MKVNIFVQVFIVCSLYELVVVSQQYMHGL